MKAHKVTFTEMERALEKVNAKFGGNVRFRSIEPKSRYINFTLAVHSCKGAGHRLGYYRSPLQNDFRRRRMSFACWHVHGEFFEALFEIAPDAYVYSRGRRIDRRQGNWQDWNIGSQMFPMYYSEACECGDSSLLWEEHVRNTQGLGTAGELPYERWNEANERRFCDECQRITTLVNGKCQRD